MTSVPGFRRLWSALGAVGVLAVGVLSVIPVSAPADVPQGDRVAHVLIYLVLAGWFCAPGARPSGVVAVLTAAYGGLLEVIQYGLPWRDGDWIDFAANGLGVILALATARGVWGRLYTGLSRHYTQRGSARHAGE